MLFKSDASVQDVYKAVRAICEDDIDAALDDVFRSMKSDQDGPKNRVQVRQLETYFRERLERNLFAYTVKYKAVGGPASIK